MMARWGKNSGSLFTWALLGACCVVFAGFATLWFEVIHRLPLEYWDGINFLLQARRLTDPEFGAVPLDLWRPRALVALLGTFDVFYKSIVGRFPALSDYHLLMAGVSTLFLIASFVAVARLWGRKASALALLFLLLTQVVHHYSMMLLADIITGLGWMLAVSVFLSCDKQEEMSSGRAAALGMLGAVAGMGKYHFLLLVPVMLFVHALSAPKRLAYPLGVALFSYVATLECGFRVFSGGEAGIVSHAVALSHQVEVAARLHRPPEIYIEGLYLMYGPIFWALALMAVFLCAKRISFRALAPKKRAVIVACLFHILLTQLITQRETRYLIPLLPIFLGALAAAIFGAARALSPRARIWWCLLWAISLLYPFSRSRNDLRTTLESPVYLRAERDLARFWAAFSEPGLNGNRCSKVIACAHSLRSFPWEFPKDQYYRSYDLGPHYQFFTGLPATLKHCPRFTSAGGEISQSFRAASDANACYVLPLEHEKGTSLALVRRLPADQGKRAAAGFTLASHVIEAKVKCEGQGDDVMCWSVREFLRE